MNVWSPHPIPAFLFRVLRLHWGECTPVHQEIFDGWTPKNFLLKWFLLFFFLRVPLCNFVAKIRRLTGACGVLDNSLHKMLLSLYPVIDVESLNPLNQGIVGY
jgi:hypothetical protein